MVAGEPVLDLTRMFSSLMRAQLTRLKIFCPQSIIHTRTFGALRSHRSRSPPSKQKEISEKDDSNVKILETRKRSAIIQTSSVIKSLAHAYAIIRAVEEKYGPVMEYRFLRVRIRGFHCSALVEYILRTTKYHLVINLRLISSSNTQNHTSASPKHLIRFKSPPQPSSKIALEG